MIRTCVAFQISASAIPTTTVRAVKDAAFEQRVKNDHQPWRRDCEHCVAGGIQSRLHKRVSCPEGYTLSLDLLGRYEPAPSELHRTVHWCLVGCFIIPQLSILKERRDEALSSKEDSPTPKVVDPTPSGCVDPPDPLGSPKLVDLDTCASGTAAPAATCDLPKRESSASHWHDEDLEEYAPSDHEAEAFPACPPALRANPPRSASTPDDPEAEASMQEEWRRKTVDLKLSSSPMQELHFVVPIPSKTETSVLDAVALVLTQIQALGYQCVRVHSDKGREFANKRLRNFLRLRGIYKTTSEGDDYKGNGRVEGAIRRLKRQARVLLHASGLDHKYWAFALQHAAARQRANAMPRLGGVVRPLLPFATRVFVRRRSWNQKNDRWEARGIQATVLAPSLEVTRGHVVLLDTGELMTTSTLLVLKPEPSTDVAPEDSSCAQASPSMPLLEQSVHSPPSIHHRITSKRRVAAVAEEVLQQEDSTASQLAEPSAFNPPKAVEFLLESRWLGKATSPSQRSVLVGGSSHVFGLFRHGGVVGVTSESERRPGFLRLLHSLVKAADPAFQYTSLTLLSQVQSLPHRDLGNVPGKPSLLLPLVMPPSGGHLWVEDPDGNLEYELPSGRSCWGRHVPLFPLQPVHVDPSRYHATQAWEEGNRLVLVAYHLRALKNVGTDLHASLQRLGFPLPDFHPFEPANPVSCQGGGGGGKSKVDRLQTDQAKSSFEGQVQDHSPCAQEAQPRVAAIRLPQSASSSSGAATSSSTGQSSNPATQSWIQSSGYGDSSTINSSTETAPHSNSASSQNSVQPSLVGSFNEMTTNEILQSLSPRSQHYLHSRARAYTRGLRFVGEDRVGGALDEIVRRGELPDILLSAEELEEEASRVVPRPTGITHIPMMHFEALSRAWFRCQRPLKLRPRRNSLHCPCLCPHNPTAPQPEGPHLGGDRVSLCQRTGPRSRHKTQTCKLKLLRVMTGTLKTRSRERRMNLRSMVRLQDPVLTNGRTCQSE